MVQLCRRTGERRPWPPTERMTFKPSRASSTSSSNRADPFPRSSRLSPAGNTRTPPRKRGRRPGPRSVGVLRISTPGAFDHSRNSTANFGRSTGWPPEDDLPRSTDCPGRGGHRPHIQLDLRAKSRRGQALVRSVVVSGLAVFRPSGKVLRIEADTISLASDSDLKIWSAEPEPLGARLDAKELHRPQCPRSGISAIFGRWPGDETDEEFEALLKENA